MKLPNKKARRQSIVRGYYGGLSGSGSYGEVEEDHAGIKGAS